jgi:hypothetical protein
VASNVDFKILKAPVDVTSFKCFNFNVQYKTDFMFWHIFSQLCIIPSHLGIIVIPTYFIYNKILNKILQSINYKYSSNIFLGYVLAFINDFLLYGTHLKEKFAFWFPSQFSK